MTKSNKDFKVALNNLVKKGIIIRFFNKEGHSYYSKTDSGIVFCPSCQYPIEVSERFKCRNCNNEYRSEIV